MHNSHHLLLLFSVLLVLSACASQPQRALKDTFITEIRADGSKMFAFTLSAKKAIEEKRTGQKRGQEGKRGNKGQMKPGRGEQGSQAGNRKDPLESRFQHQLAQTLADNGYCTSGYIELARYSSRGTMSMRGECNESASAKDKMRFPNRLR